MTAAFLVRGIPSTHVAHFWSFAQPYIKRALDHTAGELHPADLERLCVERLCQLWLVSSEVRIVGAGVTEVVSYPQRKHCRIITLAGSQFDAWKRDAHTVIEQWAVEQGCDAIEAHVRRGFVPKLIDIGYKHMYSVVLMDLNKRERAKE